ncbi:MAG: UDP-N-acetylglucosamine 2-epimerase (non-hydrolyzing) [Lentisphaeria bacterium]|nr:UDP-N-acetylglucosamine 2-epimerase (non-hydrolyzing) [Candidatus Neomarinimicrobiota bacterium]MCF7841823.1 UDP-N-acetylglucosamine 2-epimerase (non-hydrolyzing) [Lentisphaeria bacterium]
MKTKKLLSIIGARPQFVKASVVSKALRNRGVDEILVHTGQHYDDNMSRVFFEEMGIPRPDYNLEVGSGTQGAQTATTLERIERVMLEEKPDWVLVYGDTNATIAGALAAAKLHIPIAHVEAGLRSYNRTMPEEINRVVTDVLSTLLFCPTSAAVKNLEQEGMTKGVHVIGDVMVDALQFYTPLGEEKSKILSQLKIQPKHYALMTIHRPANADSPERLQALMEALKICDYPVIFPVHPRTRRLVNQVFTLKNHPVQLVDPVGYLDMMVLEKNARVIVTDSGGIQKEAYLHKVPCLTVRPETEWTETVADGWNTLVNDRIGELSGLIAEPPAPRKWSAHYGDGQAAEKITEILLQSF